MLSRHPQSGSWGLVWPVIVAAWISSACDNRDYPYYPPMGPPTSLPTATGTVTGRITNAVNGTPVAHAGVRIRDSVISADANGRFEVRDLRLGPAMLRITATGFVPFETVLTVTAEGVTRDVALTRGEVFEFAYDWYGAHAVYVPADIDTIRAVILTLGGPDTRGFATGKSLGAPTPELEASLQALGQALRTLASTHRLAVIGTSLTAMTDDPEWDPFVLDLIRDGLEMSGHPAPRTVPVLVYGMSSGAPEAIGFTVRNSGRVAGLFLKVPSAVSSATSGDVLRVPAYMVLAELDAFVNNPTLTTAFERSRGAGALWALAQEPGVPHHSLSSAQRQLTIDWMRTIVELRLPATTGDPLREIVESSGWLGNRATGEAAPWATYAGDRARASWLPSQATAREWETFVTVPASGVAASSQRSPIR